MYKNRKIRYVETILRMGRMDKGEWWRGQISLRYIVRTFVTILMCSQYNNNTITKTFFKKRNGP
jgi:hypothetical protein